MGAISAGIAYMNGADADEIWQTAYDGAADGFFASTIVGTVMGVLQADLV